MVHIARSTSRDKYNTHGRVCHVESILTHHSVCSVFIICKSATFFCRLAHGRCAVKCWTRLISSVLQGGWRDRVQSAALKGSASWKAWWCPFHQRRCCWRVGLGGGVCRCSLICMELKGSGSNLQTTLLCHPAVCGCFGFKGTKSLSYVHRNQTWEQKHQNLCWEWRHEIQWHGIEIETLLFSFLSRSHPSQ